MDELTGATGTQEKRVCVQCGIEKDIKQFRKFANMYVASHYTDTCKECYRKIDEARRLQWQQEQQKREQESLVKEQAERAIQQAQREAREQERRARDREESLAAQRVCPRCKQIRTDGHLWPDGYLHFPRFCENCANATPHSIYKLTCPLLGVVRYVGITTASLNKRLGQHVNKNSGTERKRDWIEDLRAKGLRPRIELLDEAPNEQQAKRAETRYIYHHIQQGCPLVNVEAMNCQLVLGIQNSTINFLETGEEEIDQIFHRFGLAESAERTRHHMYQQVQRQKERWRNRYKSVYIAYNAPAAIFGNMLDVLRREWELRYDKVCTSENLPTDRLARKAHLESVTEALFYTEGDRVRSDLIAHDCKFLIGRGVPIASENHNPEFHTERGSLVSIVAFGRGKEHHREYPYGKAIMHPLTYTVSQENSLALR